MKRVVIFVVNTFATSGANAVVSMILKSGSRQGLKRCRKRLMRLKWKRRDG